MTCNVLSGTLNPTTLYNTYLVRLENLMTQRVSRLMPLPGLQIYLWLHVTLTFDLLNPKLIHFTSLRMNHLCQLSSKLVYLLLKYHVYKFDSRGTDEQIYGWTNGRTTTEYYYYYYYYYYKRILL